MFEWFMKALKRSQNPLSCLILPTTHQQVELEFTSVQFSHSVVSDSLQPMNRSTPDLPVYHQLSESTQTHVH